MFHIETRFDKEELLAFIAKAHRNTYAAPKEIRKRSRMEIPFLPGHKCYLFEDGEWKYYDGYAGEDWAPGREVVLYKGQPIWSMSYQGRFTASFGNGEFFGDSTFKFLRQALMNFDDKMPFRGPSTFESLDFKLFRYNFKMNGDYEYFTGKEEVSFDNDVIFFQDVMGEVII
jgi:hypothetical protein